MCLSSLYWHLRSQAGWLELDAYYTGANRGVDPSDVMPAGAKPEGMYPSDSAVDLTHPQANPRTLKTAPADDGHGHVLRSDPRLLQAIANLLPL